MPFMKTLKELIKKRGVSVSAVARATGVPVTTIHNWLSGQPPRKIDQVKRVAEYFGVCVDYLCYEIDCITNPPKVLQMAFERDEIYTGVFEVILRKVKPSK